jgi:flagellin
MSVVIAANLVSLRLQTQLKKTTAELGSVYTRLGSGLRINSGADDPAGLALADKLRSQSKLFAVAVRNANDGLSFAAVADAGLSEITSLLQRMSELANQGANSLYSITQRSAMQTEFAALGSEITRISDTSQFNGFAALSNSSDKTIQVGISSDANSRITIGSVTATLGDLGIGSGSTLTYSLTGISIDAAVSASRQAITALAAAVDEVAFRRGVVGAASERLRAAVNTLSVMRENALAAESQVRDADIAEDVAKLARLQVLEKSQVALLAQANQEPNLVLRLLGTS